MKGTVTIIGSGLGSLVCGSILAREGFRVRVLEKHSVIGGALQTFRFGGERFDTGVHYIGSLSPGQTLYRYWKYLGLMKALKLKKMDEKGFDRIVIDGREYPVAMGWDHFASGLIHQFPGEADAIRKYCTALRSCAEAFPLYNLRAPGTGGDEERYRQTSAFAFLESLTGDRNLIRVLTGNRFLYAGSPETTPFHEYALVSHSFINSAWRIEGGSQAIALALADTIRSFGGEIHVTREAVAITKNGASFEVSTLEGESFLSDYVISGIHPSLTLRMASGGLVRKAYSERIRRLPNTPSSFAVYAVMKPGAFPYLNYNLYDEGRQWFLQTPAHEGEEKYARTLLILAAMDWKETLDWADDPDYHISESYLEFKGAQAERILSEAETHFPGLRGMIARHTASTPLTWREITGTPDGSMYGIRKDFNRDVETMIFPRTHIPGLLLTGQNVNLHGMVGTTIGAVMTCSEILGYEYLLKKIRDDK